MVGDAIDVEALVFCSAHYDQDVGQAERY